MLNNDNHISVIGCKDAQPKPHNLEDYSMSRYLNSILIRFERALRSCLCLVFRFDSWHLSPLRARPYARDIIDFLNALPPKQRTSVLEIGCGLGDIIRRLDFNQRTGLDREESVLSAARFLTWVQLRTNITYAAFTFPETALAGRYGVIIMVNWIHEVHPDVLKSNIEQFARNNLAEGGLIIVDTVGDREYRYNHDIRDLTGELHCRVQKLGSYRRDREVYAIVPLTCASSVYNP
jgi:SAM-dependent methyltransferase